MKKQNNYVSMETRNDKRYFMYHYSMDMTDIEIKKFQSAILREFLNKGGWISKHASKHDTRPEFADDEVAEKDISYWKNPMASRKLYAEIIDTYQDEIKEFVTDKKSNILVLKMRWDETVGYLCKKGDNVFKKVDWVCAIIQKNEENKLFTKTYYPCANPNA